MSLSKLFCLQLSTGPNQVVIPTWLKKLLTGRLSIKQKKSYGKCSVILNTFLYLFSKKKCYLSGLDFTIPNREDPDQTASLEAV